MVYKIFGYKSVLTFLLLFIPIFTHSVHAQTFTDQKKKWQKNESIKIFDLKESDSIDKDINSGKAEKIIKLNNNYPNPFNPQTKINYELSVPMEISLNIYNSLGQRVHTLIDKIEKPAGKHQVVFEAGNLPSGIYFYQLQTGSTIQTRKMMLVK